MERKGQGKESHCLEKSKSERERVRERKSIEIQTVWASRASAEGIDDASVSRGKG